MDPERLLLSFGPLGVTVQEGPFGLFRWHWTNVHAIELTDRRIRGSRRFRFLSFKHPRGGAAFDIPYAAILSVKLLPHPWPLSLMKVLDITYRDAQGISEKSIATYTARAEQAFAILQHHLRTPEAAGARFANPGLG